jgi:hypothetical protein
VFHLLENIFLVLYAVTYLVERHYATNRQVAGLIPNEVTGFFNLPKPSSRTMALGSTQPLTEMSTRNLPGGEGRSTYKAWQPHRHLWTDCLEKLWEPRRLTFLWASTGSYRDSVTLCWFLHNWKPHLRQLKYEWERCSVIDLDKLFCSESHRVSYFLSVLNEGKAKVLHVKAGFSWHD